MARARRKLVPPQPKARGDSAQRLTAAFLDYLRGECRLADNTVAAYQRDITRFRRWLGDRNITDLKIA
ncbi:MAG TPA: site-specific integrase, partial [Pirellulaceae bacterium]|nr:site-specific integrase [Pirellulaceae bacterium]